jgi:hypothetical protein
MIHHKQERGVALYISIVMMTALLGIVFGLGTVVVGQLKLLRGIGNSVLAFYAADTGIERVLYEDNLLAGGDILDCDGGGAAPAFCSGTLLNLASFKVVVDTSGDCPIPADVVVYCMESFGSFQNTVRSVFIER